MILLPVANLQETSQGVPLLPKETSAEERRISGMSGLVVETQLSLLKHGTFSKSLATFCKVPPKDV